MTREEFLCLTEGKLFYLDGATGSNLVKAGMPAGVCPEKWILENPDVMLKLQKRYVAAGTDILYAPTFTANRIKLGEYGLAGDLEKMIRELVKISRQAADSAPEGRRVYVAGDLTMTGEQLKPQGTMELEELIDVYKEQILALESAGVDLLVVETMMSLAEARAALIAAREVTDLAVMVTLTFEPDGRTLFGTDAETAAVVLESLGACAVGANCSTGPDRMRELIGRMAAVTRIPIIAKPNAGLPQVDGQGNTVYDMDAETFAREMETLVCAGAAVLGGCCGTTPEYIEKLCKSFGREQTCGDVSRRPDGVRYLTSERQTLAFDLDGSFFVVGERINPTGKKALQEQLREGSLEKVLQFAEEQEEAGARVLDVNLGMSGIDEKEMMLQVIGELSLITNLPLSLDSSHVDVLEAALRHYPGRALVNSVSLEKEKLERLLPVVAKYGAMFILLPLSDRGLPENLEEKKAIIDAIAERALSLGMRREDIVVDGLVTTVGANRRAGIETLETISYCRGLGLATVCGLSNISFGMPERGYVNTAFLTMAIQAGLTMAIANPSQELLMAAAYASDLLLAKEEAELRYIEYAGKLRERRELAEKAQTAGGRTASPDGRTGSADSKTGGSDSHAGSPDGGTGSPDSKTGNSDSKPGKTDGKSGDADDKSKAPHGKSGDADDKSKAPDSKSEAADSRLRSPAGNSAPQNDTRVMSGHRADLEKAVLKGNRSGIERITKEALAGGEEPQSLLNEVLLPAINQVGELFDKGKYFLPQLIASAEAMKLAIGVLEPLLLRESSEEDRPVVVIATVEGDIHDIGKNLVALMLKNYGFQVIDLGKDVPEETIIRAAREHNAKIIALSALMTTTMQRMRQVVERVRRERLPVRVMIGGAVITQEYAAEIGADGYSRDAAEAVRVAKRLIEDAPGD